MVSLIFWVLPEVPFCHKMLASINLDRKNVYISNIDNNSLIEFDNANDIIVEKSNLLGSNIYNSILSVIPKEYKEDVIIKFNSYSPFIQEVEIKLNEEFIMRTYSSKQLDAVADHVRMIAAQKASGAAMEGAMHDGGASEMKENHARWLDGYLCGAGMRDESTFYHSIIEDIERKNDPEYKRYLELKQKFGE